MNSLSTRAALVFAMVLPCAGCLAKYQSVASGGQSATFVMTRSAHHLGRTSLQTYDAFSDDTCSKPALRGRLAALLTNGLKLTKNAQVTSGEPINVQATTTMWGGRAVQNPEPGAVSIAVDRCINFIRFSPLPGHQYEFKQEAPTLSACHVEIIDLGTLSPPPDLVVQDASRCSAV